MRSFGCLSLFTMLVSILLGITGQSSVENILPPTPELFNIVWSTQDIPCGTLITEDMVALVPTPIEMIPISPTPYLSWVIGKYTPQDIPEDVQVFYNSLLDTPPPCNNQP